MADYFTDETDEAIKKYLKAEDIEEKNRIFSESIRPAFEKLSENLIYVYGFYNIDDIETLKMDCLTNLYHMLPKFDPDRGAKGFSYFNVIAKNWFIQKSKDIVKRSKQEADLYIDIDHERVKDDQSISLSSYEDELRAKEAWLALMETMPKWKDRLTKQSEKKVLEAIVFLFKNVELINIFSKKAVYLYLRELTGLNTKQVVSNLKKIRNVYLSWKSMEN